MSRAWQEAKADNVSMLAGGVAFFGFLAIFPALIALLTLYGPVADPAQAARRIEPGSPTRSSACSPSSSRP